MKTIKLDKCKDVPENYTGIVKYHDGSIEYYLEGRLHREDGPAAIDSMCLIYYSHNKFHRCDGPAIINEKGEFYFLNDINITDEVNEWIKENNIPKVWDKSHKLLFKLTFDVPEQQQDEVTKGVNSLLNKL